MIRAALYTYLSANAGVQAIVGSPARVFPVKLPQGIARPALVYRRTTGDHAHYLSGSAGHAKPLFEFVCLADTYADADALAEAVRQACDGATNQTVAGVTIKNIVVADEQDDFEEPIDGGDTGVYSIHLFYRVTYSESVPSP